MGIIKHNGKVEWVDAVSVHRLTGAEARAFILFSKAEQRRHQQDIDNIEDTIQLVEMHLGILERKREYGKDGIFLFKGGENEK